LYRALVLRLVALCNKPPGYFLNIHTLTYYSGTDCFAECNTGLLQSLQLNR